MFSICKKIIENNRLDEDLRSMAESEKLFTADIGAISRRFYECIQQPHIIWCITRWSSEKAHNNAAEGIMKVRRDDRVASAYFRPGLYFEIFCREVENSSICVSPGKNPGATIICHGLVSDRRIDGWEGRIAQRISQISGVGGLLQCRTFRNYHCTREFVGFMVYIQ